MFKNNCKKDKKWTKNSMYLLLASVSTTQMYAQDIIPSEVKTTFDSVKTWLTNDIAAILLGIFWICSCIAYGFNKDSNKAKGAFIAVSIACAGVALATTIVSKFTTLSTK